MATRTKTDAVRDVLVKDYDGETNLMPYILTANAMLNDMLVIMAQRNSAWSLSPATQELIERYLAAHFYCSMDQLYAQKTTGGASATFQGKTADFLQGTKYGQVALRLDWTGTLQALDRRQIASAAWLGTTCHTVTGPDSLP